MTEHSVITSEQNNMPIEGSCQVFFESILGRDCSVRIGVRQIEVISALGRRGDEPSLEGDDKHQPGIALRKCKAHLDEVK